MSGWPILVGAAFTAVGGIIFRWRTRWYLSLCLGLPGILSRAALLSLYIRGIDPRSKEAEQYVQVGGLILLAGSAIYFMLFVGMHFNWIKLN
jgi:hypothetical protein